MNPFRSVPSSVALDGLCRRKLPRNRKAAEGLRQLCRSRCIPSGYELLDALALDGREDRNRHAFVHHLDGLTAADSQDRGGESLAQLMNVDLGPHCCQMLAATLAPRAAGETDDRLASGQNLDLTLVPGRLGEALVCGEEPHT